MLLVEKTKSAAHKQAGLNGSKASPPLPSAVTFLSG